MNIKSKCKNTRQLSIGLDHEQFWKGTAFIELRYFSSNRPLRYKKKKLNEITNRKRRVNPKNKHTYFFFILLLNSDFLHFWCTNNQQYVPKY